MAKVSKQLQPVSQDAAQLMRSKLWQSLINSTTLRRTTSSTRTSILQKIPNVRC